MPDPALHWHFVCNADELPEEELIEFEHGDEVYVVCHTPSGFHATHGLCTHEQVRLCDGMVIGEILECPRHQGRFHIPSGAAKSAPVCDALRTFPTKVEKGKVFLGLPV
jgi:3-phenylpropionate/trans-cinnamate dioxygenase ferredoxin component